MTLAAAMATSQIISAVSGIAGGFSANSAASAQAKSQAQQANQAIAENDLAIGQKRQDIVDFTAQQEMGYNSSGVTLDGSPLTVLERTRSMGQQELDMMRQRGFAMQNLAQMQVKQTQNQGRAALIGSLFKAGTGSLDAYTKGKQTGVFGNNSKATAATVNGYDPLGGGSYESGGAT